MTDPESPPPPSPPRHRFVYRDELSRPSELEYEAPSQHGAGRFHFFRRLRDGVRVMLHESCVSRMQAQPG